MRGPDCPEFEPVVQEADKPILGGGLSSSTVNARQEDAPKANAGFGTSTLGGRKGFAGSIINAEEEEGDCP